MKKIFVAGGTGFIGRALIERLVKDGYQVTALARSPKEAKQKYPQVKWVKGEIRECAWHRQVQGCDTFVHLVGILGFIKLPWSERLSIELDGTKNAVLAAKKANISHFVYISTAYTEAGTDYGKAKKITKKWVEGESKKGFPVTTVCPVAVYGPGDLTNMKRLFQAIKSGKFFFIGGGKVCYYDIYIDDLIDGLMAVIKNPKKSLGQTFIFSNSQVGTFNKFVGTVAKYEQVVPPRLSLPKGLMMTAGFFSSFLAKLGLPVPLTLDTVKSLTFNQDFDLKPTQKLLGFKAKVTLEEGIRRTTQWYRRHQLI